MEHYEIERMDLETGRWVRVGKAKGTDYEVTGYGGSSKSSKIKKLNKLEFQNWFSLCSLTPGHKYKFRVIAG